MKAKFKFGWFMQIGKGKKNNKHKIINKNKILKIVSKKLQQKKDITWPIMKTKDEKEGDSWCSCWIFFDMKLMINLLYSLDMHKRINNSSKIHCFNILILAKHLHLIFLDYISLLINFFWPETKYLVSLYFHHDQTLIPHIFSTFWSNLLITSLFSLSSYSRFNLFSSNSSFLNLIASSH